MRILPEARAPGTASIVRSVYAVILLSLGACANGDFGEVKPSLVREDTHDWVGVEAVGSISGSRSRFELTEDERQLRDLAYPLIEPPYDRQRWYSIAGEYGLLNLGRRFDRTAYPDHLFTTPFRSVNGRYAQLIDDIRNDTTRLPQFFETAARVVDIDRKRQQSLRYIGGLTGGDQREAMQRVRENAAIIRMVQASLEGRADAYQLAMERLVLMTPSPQAVDVERTLTQMRVHLARYRTGAPTGRNIASSTTAR